MWLDWASSPCTDPALPLVRRRRREPPQRIRHLVRLPDRHELPRPFVRRRQPKATGKGPSRKVSSPRKVAVPQLRVFLKRVHSPAILRGSGERPQAGACARQGLQFAPWARRKTAPWRGDQGHGQGDLPWSQAEAELNRQGEWIGRCVRRGEVKAPAPLAADPEPYRPSERPGLWDRASLGGDGPRKPSGSSANSQIPPSRCLSEGPSRHPREARHLSLDVRHPETRGKEWEESP
jgi:hypothetical protein